MYVSMYVYMYVCMYVCMYVWPHMCVCMYGPTLIFHNLANINNTNINININITIGAQGFTKSDYYLLKHLLG